MKVVVDRVLQVPVSQPAPAGRDANPRTLDGTRKALRPREVMTHLQAGSAILSPDVPLEAIFVAEEIPGTVGVLPRAIESAC